MVKGWWLLLLLSLVVFSPYNASAHTSLYIEIESANSFKAVVDVTIAGPASYDTRYEADNDFNGYVDETETNYYFRQYFSNSDNKLGLYIDSTQHTQCTCSPVVVEDFTGPVCECPWSYSYTISMLFGDVPANPSHSLSVWNIEPGFSYIVCLPSDFIFSDKSTYGFYDGNCVSSDEGSTNTSAFSLTYESSNGGNVDDKPTKDNPVATPAVEPQTEQSDKDSRDLVIVIPLFSVAGFSLIGISGISLFSIGLWVRKKF